MYKETLSFWMGRQGYKEESIPTLVWGFTVYSVKLPK